MTTHKQETRKERKRRQLFDLFSKNLSYIKRYPGIRVEPDEEDTYFCPICLSLFTREEGLSNKPEYCLTLEDVPPASLGGKPLILTCKACNSWAGAELDSELGKKLNLEKFVKGSLNSSLNTRLFLDEKTHLAAKIRHHGETGLFLEYDNEAKRSDRKNVTKFEEQLTSKSLGKFKLRFTGFRLRRPEVALLRIAYLFAFSRFGYGFLANLNLEPIRDQIRKPDENILPPSEIFVDYPKEAVGVNIITAPKELQSFLVVFDLTISDNTSRHGVVLPGPTEPGLNIYQWMLKNPGGKENRFRLKCSPIPQGDYLSHPDQALALNNFWSRYAQ
jgi:hypothetical protein